MLAAKQKTDEPPFLAASGVLWHGGSLPETRVMGLPAGNQTGIGGCWPVTSTLVWGSRYRCDGMASGRLVGLDYADQRYYASGYGRFNNPDPVGTLSADVKDPSTWNEYSYVSGDPINGYDPSGLCDVVIGGITQSSTNSDVEAYAASISAISVYPYSSASNNSSLIQKLSNVLAGILEVAAQAYSPTSSTYAAVVGLALASKDGAPINVTTFSGGAAAFSAAVQFLNTQGDAGQAITSAINSVTYVAPGAFGSLYSISKVTLIDGGVANGIIGAATGTSYTNWLTDRNHCGHSFGCLIDEFPAYLTVGDPCSAPAIVNQPPK